MNSIARRFDCRSDLLRAFANGAEVSSLHVGWREERTDETDTRCTRVQNILKVLGCDTGSGYDSQVR